MILGRICGDREHKQVDLRYRGKSDRTLRQRKRTSKLLLLKNFLLRSVEPAKKRGASRDVHASSRNHTILAIKAKAVIREHICTCVLAIDLDFGTCTPRVLHSVRGATAIVL